MARKKREIIQLDQSVEEFVGSALTPSKNKLDNVEIGLSIEAIQHTTKDLVNFKSIKQDQLMAITETDEKRAILLSNLHQWREQSAWIAGRLLTAIKDKIQVEFNAWAQKGEKKEDKPEHTSFKSWIEKHENTLGFKDRTARDYMWLYANVEFERSSLGTKKMKIIKEVKDPVLRERIEQKAIEENLSIDGIKELVEKTLYSVDKKKEREEEAKEILKQIDFNIENVDGKYVIQCGKNQKEYITESIIHYENQIKLYAQRLMEMDSKIES